MTNKTYQLRLRTTLQSHNIKFKCETIYKKSL